VVGGHNARPALHTESFAGRFAIGVAPHWTAGEEGTAVAVTAPGSGVEINIYFEAGDRPLGQLADSARSFLRQRHPGGQIGAPQRQPLAHLQALRITDSYPGGTEVAIVLTSGGYTYLLLERVDNGVPGRVMEQADAELASFRPL
jgi:hypothetical protein